MLYTFRNRPPLPIAARSAVLAGEQALGQPRADRTDPVSESHLDYTATLWRDHAEGGPLILNIEPVPQAGRREDDAYIERFIDQSIAVVNGLRQRGVHQVGIFNIPPYEVWGHAKPAKYGHQVKAWERIVSRLAMQRNDAGQFSRHGLIDAVDLLCPCCYLAKVEDNTIWMRPIIRRAQAFQRRVIPFLWSRYNDSTDKYGSSPSPDAARKVCDCLLAEGVQDVFLYRDSRELTDADMACIEVYVEAFT